jgi:hypothetical protein
MPGPLTAASALSTIQQLVNDLSRAMREIGPLPALRELSADLANLASYCQGREVDVDVAVSGTISPEDSSRAAAWISPELEPDVLASTVKRGAEVRSLVEEGRCVVRVFPATRPAAQKAARPRSAVLVWLSAESAAELPPLLDDMVDDRPLVLIVRHSPDPAADVKLAKSAAHPPWICQSLNLAELPPDGLTQRIQAAGPDLGILLRTYAALYGLETAAETLKLVIEQEQRTIRVKRATAQQKTAKLQLGGSNLAETVTDMRVRVQRTLSDFEKSVQDGVAELFLPQVGSLSRIVEERLTAIVDLERITKEKSIQLRLLPADEADLLGIIREGIRDRAYTDLRSFRDLLELVSNDIDHTLAAAGAPPVTIRHSQVPDSRVTRVLESSVRIDRPYRGELPKQGLQEYLQEAKKYQGLLYMVMSTVGLSALPAVRKYTVPASIGLMVVGAALLPRSIRRERAETIAREVERARDVLRTESRRVFSEAERGWTTAISDALRDEQATVLLQFEAAMREGQSRRNVELTDERGRLQRALEGLQHAEGQLGVSGRTRDAVLNAGAQLRGGLRQLVAGRVAAMGGSAR